jgi:hypothetical protein
VNLAPVRVETPPGSAFVYSALPAQGEWAMLRSLGIEPLDHTGLGLFLSESGWFINLGWAFGFFSGLFGLLEGGGGVVAMTAGRASPEFFATVLAIADEHGWGGLRA